MNIDIGPTFVALSGQDIPPQMDGKSLIELWTKKKTGAFRSDILVEHYGEHSDAFPDCPQDNGQGLFVSNNFQTVHSTMDGLFVSKNNFRLPTV